MENNNTSLFEANGGPTGVHKTPKWRLVASQRNLMYMLAAGLIMSPKGFGGKYYRDTLSTFAGWIPLFADHVPREAIELAVSEKRNLTPCLVTVDLKAVRGRIMTISSDGHLREIEFPDGLNGTEWALLVPSPLPVNSIESISFASKEDKSACEADARDYGNVPLLDFKRDVDARLFSKTTHAAWPPTGATLANRDDALDKPFAAGGIMAMLFQMANRGDLALQACHDGFDGGAEAPSISDPMLREIGTWMKKGRLGESTDILPQLFWGAVASVVKCRSAAEGTSPHDVVLAYIQTAGAHLDERMKLALSKLAEDLRGVIGFSDSTVTELFERHPKPFSRVMTLFFLREKCSDLLEFRHPLLTEVDYVAAAILFAARDGWLGLPLELRKVEGLQEAVTHRMAVMAHRMAGSEIDLGAPPSRPLPLRELFVAENKGWSPRQREAALLLARESKWGGCIRTRITLGKGKYEVVIDGSGVNILLPGEVKAVATEIDPVQFFTLLARESVLYKADQKVRTLFKA
jgi:hypothetical protein